MPRLRSVRLPCSVDLSSVRSNESRWLGCFEHCGETLAAADTHGFQAEAAAAAAKLVHHRGEHPNPGCADGVAERDSGTVHVESVVVVPIPFLQDRQNLRGES